MPYIAMFLQKVQKCIINLDIEGIKIAVKEAVEAGIPPYEVVIQGMRRGMDVVGEKYESKEYFLADLIMAAETMKSGMEVLKPYLKASPAKATGVVVIGTVKGDMHDIGKNLVATLLTSAGFEVHDLGMDVPTEKFIDEVKKTNANILAMSALLTLTMTYMKTVIDELKKMNLRDKVKVIVGGQPLTEDYAKEIGADAFGRDAVIGVEICKKLITG